MYSHLKHIKPIDSVCSQNNEIQIHYCPLCLSKDYELAHTFSIDKLIDMWIEERNFNPINDIYRHKTLEQRRCKECGLFYYNYLLVDTTELYELLSQKNYYPKSRPEYEIGINIVKKLEKSSLIELGCGCGNFLVKVAPFIKNYIGTESNKTALSLCKEKNVQVTDHLSQSQKFDIVCHFELIEHITNIEEFMKFNVSLLNDNGFIIIGTPNPNSILNFTCTTILDLPPHHKYIFSKQTFEWLAKKYQLEIIEYQTTSLDDFRYSIYKNNINTNESFQCLKQKYVGDTHVIVFKKK